MFTVQRLLLHVYAIMSFQLYDGFGSIKLKCCLPHIWQNDS